MNLFAKQYDIVKFVRVNSEYRFCHLDCEHRMLVKQSEKAETAGFIQYDSGEFRL